MTRRHGCGAGMGLVAREPNIIGTFALTTSDDTYDLLFRFQGGSLFDMGFEIGSDCSAAYWSFAHVADTLQLITKTFARLVLLTNDVFVFEHAGEDARAVGQRGATSARRGATQPRAHFLGADNSHPLYTLNSL